MPLTLDDAIAQIQDDSDTFDAVINGPLGGTVLLSDGVTLVATLASALAAIAQPAEYPSRAVAAASNIPVGLTWIRTAGFYTPGDLGGALYVRQVGAPAGAGHFQSADGSWWKLSMPYGTPFIYGAKGDGATDDTAAFQDFLNSCSLRRNYLGKGTFKATGLLSVALTGCSIIGVPGFSVVTGAFDYALLRLLDLDGVVFEDATFQTTYVNAAENVNKGVVYSLLNNVLGAAFKRCAFIGPHANTDGLGFFPRQISTDHAAQIAGLKIEDCEFSTLGRNGCTIRNYGTNADKYTAVTGIYFNRNQCDAIGGKGSSGRLLQMDGYGQIGEFNDNVCNGGLVNGMEINGFKDFKCERNMFVAMPAGVGTLSLNGGVNGVAGDITGATVHDNRCVGAAGKYANFNRVKDSRFADNYWNNSGAAGANGTQAALFTDCASNRFSKDKYVGSGSYAALAQSVVTTANDNEWYECDFDNSAAGANIATISFQNAGTANNVVRKSKVKQGVGGVNFASTAGAINNELDNDNARSLIEHAACGAI